MRVQAKAFGRVAAGVSPIAASMRVTALLPLHGPVVASSMAELLRKYRCALHMLLCARRMHTVIPSAFCDAISCIRLWCRGVFRRACVFTCRLRFL